MGSSDTPQAITSVKSIASRAEEIFAQARLENGRVTTDFLLWKSKGEKCCNAGSAARASLGVHAQPTADASAHVPTYPTTSNGFITNVCGLHLYDASTGSMTLPIL